MSLPAPPTYQFTSSAAATLEVGQSVVVAVDKANGYTCPADGCGPATWAITGEGCAGAAIPDGDSATLTAGAGATFSIDTTAIKVTGLTCTLEATIKDAYNRAVKQSVSVQVSGTWGGPAPHAACAADRRPAGQPAACAGPPRPTHTHAGTRTPAHARRPVAMPHPGVCGRHAQHERGDRGRRQRQHHARQQPLV